MAQFLSELEQDPFDPEEFVERLAWRAAGGISMKTDGKTFDPMVLHDAFEQTIRDLKMLQENTQRKVERLEGFGRDDGKQYAKKITELLDKNKAAFSSFQELDDKINFVATKVVHLGDQLESVNTPRSRAEEAQKLMSYFAEFLSPGPLISEVFTDKTQLHQAADVIQKLNSIVQELPAKKFDDARKRIAQKYDEIERCLIEEFVRSHRADDIARMKEIAAILSHFKGYSQCIDAFIEQSQLGAFMTKDIFAEVIPLCEKNFVVMNQVFINHDQVMAKFVLNIYHGKLREHIQSKLANANDPESNLKNLYELFVRTTKLSNDLSLYNMGSDNRFLSKLTKNIFQTYLDTYIRTELVYLREKCSTILHRYYESKGHQKKSIQSGGIQDWKRNIQAIGTRANINIGTVENYGGVTFLSEEVAINLLQEFKLAFKRCQALSRQSDLPNNAVKLVEILLHSLCMEHIDYALELGLQAIPMPEPKTSPEIYYLDVVQQCNAIMHLLEKLFSDSIVPLVASTPKHGDCVHKMKIIQEQMESKLDLGLDRSLQAIVGWIKNILQSEQKKTDFKPEVEETVTLIASNACSKVVKFVNAQVEKIKDCLDGKNVEAALLELGSRFNRVVFEHLQQFQYSSVGAMQAICDVNEYRKCVREFNVPLVNGLFDTLYALCNLLVVAPENLKQVSVGDQLVCIDRAVLQSFVQLRVDYKTARLGVQLK